MLIGGRYNSIRAYRSVHIQSTVQEGTKSFRALNKIRGISIEPERFELESQLTRGVQADPKDLHPLGTLAVRQNQDVACTNC